MKRSHRFNYVAIGALGLLGGLALSALAEDITLTTAYPSPRGVYKELKVTRDTHLAYEGAPYRVGVGTTSPLTKLDVVGDIRIADGTEGPEKVLTSNANGVASWQTASSIPAGAVMFFNLAACPSGWTELTAARGRVITGLPLSGTLAGTVGTALTNLENRTHTHTGPSHTHTIPSHAHTVDPPDTRVRSEGGDSGRLYDSSSAWVNIPAFNSGGTTLTSDAAGTGATGTAATSNVMPYIQLLACQKS